MKKLIRSLSALCVCAVLSGYAATSLVFVDFENPPYQMAPVIGQQNWITAGYDAGNDVTNVNVGAGAQSLLLNQKTGGAATYSMVRLNISNTPGYYAAINLTQHFMRISFMIRPDSTYDAVDIRNPAFVRMILAPVYVDGFQVSGDASAKLPCTYATWQTVSVLLDCLQNKAIQITRDNQIGTISRVFENTSASIPGALRFSTQYASPAPGGSGVGQAYFDNVSVGLEPAFRLTASVTSLAFFQHIVTQTYTIASPYPDEVHTVTNYGTAPWIVSVTPALVTVSNTPVTITVVVNHSLISGPATAAVIAKADANTLAVAVNNVYDAYFVAPTGNDANNGITSNTPFKTLAHAINVCGNGLVDRPITVNVAEGEYAGECTDVSGTNWIVNFDGRSYINVLGAGPNKSYLTQGGKNWFIVRNAEPSAAPSSAPLVFRNATGVRFSGFTIIATNPPATNSDMDWYPDFFTVVSIQGGNGLTLDNMKIDCRYDGPIYIMSLGVWTNDWRVWYGSVVHIGSEGSAFIQPSGVLLENILWRGGATFAFLNGYNGRDVAGNTNIITVRNCTMVEGIDLDKSDDNGHVIYRHGPVVYANHARFILQNNVIATHPKPGVPGNRNYYAITTDGDAFTNKYGQYTITLEGNVLYKIGNAAPYERWCNNFNSLYFPPNTTNLFAFDPLLATVNSHMYTATGVFAKGWYVYSENGGASGNLAAPSVTGGVTNVPPGGTILIVTNGVTLSFSGTKLPGSWLYTNGVRVAGVGYIDATWSVNLTAPEFTSSPNITYLLTLRGSPESLPTTITLGAVPEPAATLVLGLLALAGLRKK